MPLPVHDSCIVWSGREQGEAGEGKTGDFTFTWIVCFFTNNSYEADMGKMFTFDGWQVRGHVL